MSANNWPNNKVYNYVPPKQRLGNKTLFTTSVNDKNSIYGNTTVRYFSGTDAEIYFDELYIDEVVQIQYQIQQNTMPLFGYNSYVYDQVARGSRIINGSFTINFTKANYLYDILNVLTDQAISSDMMVNKANDGTLIDQDSDFGITEQPKLAMNTLYGPILNKTFEIVLSYGDAKKGNVSNSTMLILTGVVLTGCSQTFGINGDPVYETYTFIAKDIASTVVTSNAPATTTSTDQEEAAITIDEISYTEGIDAATNKISGNIKLLYHSPYPINEIKLQLSIPLESEVGMISIATVNQYSNTVPDTITHLVSDDWRKGIKQYCLDNPVIIPGMPSTIYEQINHNPSSLKIEMIFSYKENGNLTTQSISRGMKLNTVYTEK